MEEKNKKRKIDNRNNTIKCHVDLATTSTTWADLDANLLQKVFQLVPPLELLSTISLVCHSWLLSCWDFLFWKDDSTLDLSKYNCLLDIRMRPVERYPKLFLDTLGCMMSGCHVAKDIASRRITKIVFSRFLNMEDKHLIYVAKRSPELKMLILPNTCSLTTKGLTMAVQNWRELEEISFGQIYNHKIDHIIQGLGINCKSLNTLSIFGTGTLSSTNFRLDEYNAQVIAENLCMVQVIIIENTRVYKHGLNFILHKCKQLSKLSLTDCRGVVDRPACFGAKSAIFYKHHLSVEIRRRKEGKLTRWSIGTTNKLYNLKELIHHIWS